MGEENTDVDKESFKMKVLGYVKRRNRLRANLEKIYTLILGQITEPTRMKLEGLLDWGGTYDVSGAIK